MIGKAIKYNEKNINTDLIIPARYLIKSDLDHLAGHCMEDLDPEFNRKREKLNAIFLVAGSNFGCGSSREQAPLSLKAAGIKCVIAPSFARIFFRNSINIGLPIIEFKEINAINSGDELDVNFDKGTLKNLTSNKKYKIKKLPPFLQEIISVDGLINFSKIKILKNS
ncbi:MAG: 3-isopropylmalate dehydratase small subunit [Promethearchaeota archaeon]